MHCLRTASLGALCALCLTTSVALAQDEPPATGAATSFLVDLTQGSNLVALPVLPDSTRIGALMEGALPNLTFVQDDSGRYFLPAQGIDGIGAWSWDEAYRIEVSSPTSFFVEGAAILPEASPLLIEDQMGNWVPYFRRDAMAVEDALASIAAVLSRVEAADGRFYSPTDQASTLDSLRTGQGYKVWVSESAVLTYPPNSTPPDGEDTTPPSAPASLTASAGSGRVVLAWNANTEEDLAGLPYTVKRGETAGGPYATLSSTGENAYTDNAVTNGTTYYYIVTATDEAGNESAPSAERAATPQAPAGGIFALPASATPTATDEAIGMRAMFRDDPKQFNRHVSTAYDGATTQGERLWLGIGGVGYSYAHPAVTVEPDAGGDITSKYITEVGALYDLPPLGTRIGTSGYPQKLYMSHEGTDMGAAVDYSDGSTAVHILVMDGLGGPYLSFRFTEEADGTQRTDTVTINGVNFSSYHKHHTLDATANGMVVMHSVDNDVDFPWPSLIVNRGEDADFIRPGADYTSPRHLTLRVGAIGDSVYVVSNEDPVFSVVYAVGADSSFVETRVADVAEFWEGSYTPINGFGPTPRYIGPAAGNPGFVIYSGGASRLDYHNGVSGNVMPVDEVTAYMYQRVRRVVDGALVEETWRVTSPGLRVQRLAALDVGSSSATPTWVTEADLNLPAGWEPSNVHHVEITESGSVWLIGERPATFPATGVTEDDISVAYYRGGGAP